MAEPTETTDSTSGAETAPGTQPPAVDVQAQINQALSEQQATFNTQLKEVTGVESLKELKDAQLAEQGKTQELLDSKSSELAAVTKRFQDSQINAALLNAAAGAIDPGTVAALLKGDCSCDDNGVVTVNGLSTADAVKALLEQKPFLAKADGGPGSGAPQTTIGTNSLTRAAFDALDLTAKAKFIREGGLVSE